MRNRGGSVKCSVDEAKAAAMECARATVDQHPGDVVGEVPERPEWEEPTEPGEPHLARMRIATSVEAAVKLQGMLDGADAQGGGSAESRIRDGDIHAARLRARRRRRWRHGGVEAPAGRIDEQLVRSLTWMARAQEQLERAEQGEEIDDVTVDAQLAHKTTYDTCRRVMELLGRQELADAAGRLGQVARRELPPDVKMAWDEQELWAYHDQIRAQRHTDARNSTTHGERGRWPPSGARLLQGDGLEMTLAQYVGLGWKLVWRALDLWEAQEAAAQAGGKKAAAA